MLSSVWNSSHFLCGVSGTIVYICHHGNVMCCVRWLRSKEHKTKHQLFHPQEVLCSILWSRAEIPKCFNVSLISAKVGVHWPNCAYQPYRYKICTYLMSIYISKGTWCCFCEVSIGGFVCHCVYFFGDYWWKWSTCLLTVVAKQSMR